MGTTKNCHQDDVDGKGAENKLEKVKGIVQAFYTTQFSIASFLHFRKVCFISWGRLVHGNTFVGIRSQSDFHQYYTDISRHLS